jgi:O-antigen ligase
VFFNVIFIFVPIFVSALTTLVLAVYILTRAENRRKLSRIPFGFFLIIWAVLSLTAGLIHKNIIGDGAFIIYISFIIFSIYAFTAMTKELCRRIIQLSSVLGIAAFLVALVQFIVDPVDRSVSTFFNANYYGFICEIIILVSFYALLSFRNWRIFYLISIAVNIGGLLLSGCRSAWLAVFGGAIVIMICFKEYRKLLVAFVSGVTCTGVVILFPQIIPRFGSMDTTESLRFQIWQTAFNGFLKHPFIGQGFMSYWILSHGMGRADQPHAHNILLNALDSYGAVGVILLLIFIVPAVIACVKKLKIRPVCALVLGVITAIIIHGITDDPILGMQTGIFGMVILALGGARSDEELRGSTQT